MYLECCKKECDKKVTAEEVINTVYCGFCDIPYILLGENAE